MMPVFNNNYFLRYFNIVYDASNPNKNSSSIPANATALPSIKDLAKSGNDMAQATGANQPTYIHTAVNGLNVFNFNSASSQFMSRAGSSINNYNGEMAGLAIVKTDTIAAGVSRVMRKSTTGWSFGRSADKYIFTTHGRSDFITTGAQFVAGTWQVMGVVLKNVAGTWSVDFYKNRTLVENVVGLSPSGGTGTLYFGSLDNVAEFFSGQIQLACTRFSKINSAEMNLALDQACKRIGI